MIGEPQERHECAADAHHFAASLHHRQHRGQGAERLPHRQRGHDEPLVAHLHEQPLDDRQCERQADGECRAPSLDRIDLDRAAEPFDIAADDVHAHPAAR